LQPRSVKVTIYKTIILPLVLYAHETWSFAIREELRVFENSTFGPKRDEVTGEWKKLRNEELHNLYFSKGLNVLECVMLYNEITFLIF
jgi:hypothetical protein